jgi:hypothetical protein
VKPRGTVLPVNMKRWKGTHRDSALPSKTSSFNAKTYAIMSDANEHRRMTMSKPNNLLQCLIVVHSSSDRTQSGLQSLFLWGKLDHYSH